MASGKKTSKGKFSVDTRPTKALVVGGLTRDIGVSAAVFDLIDNSIDAARDTIFASGPEKPGDGLPKSYAGFYVDLKLSGDGCSIDDNCGGITVDALKTMVLRFGQPSSHPLGIGIFGLGLNRAIFKLGRVSHLKTDTGSQRAELVLNVDEYLRSDDWYLPAQEFTSSGQPGTTVEIAQLPDKIAALFADHDWVDEYRRDVGRRYAKFIRKGFRITVNGVNAQDGEVQIRKRGPFPEEYKSYKADGVTIHIRFGQHSEHRFSAERDYDKSRNIPLTGEFGWTVICNDRAIVVSDQTYKTGWETKFHNEFYGFAGVVSFEAQEPGLLPWDTTKFDVEMNNRAYQLALLDMRKFAEKWRSYANQAKDAQRKKVELRPLPDAASGNDSGAKGSKSGSKPASKPSPHKTQKPPTRKKDHNEFGTVLPDDVDEINCFDKQLALVHEAKALDLNVLAYSGMALIRCLFEASVATYLDRHGRLADLKAFAIEKRKKDDIEVRDEKKVIPSLDEAIAFLELNPDIWGESPRLS